MPGTGPTVDRRCWAAVLLVVLLAGCGGGDGDQQAAEPSGAPPATSSSAAGAAEPKPVDDPCSLMTAAEAEAALGQPVGPGEPSEQTVGRAVTCLYPRKELGFGSVSVTAFLDPQTADQFQQLQAAYPDAETVDDIGEAAFVTGAAASARKDGRLVTVTVVPAKGVKPSAEQMRTLLRAVVGRL